MSGWRCWLLRRFGATIGKGCSISNSVDITKSWELILGNHVTIDDGCWIDAPVTLDDWCSIGKCSKLISDGHDVRSRGFEYECERIVIGASAFIGADSYVGMGVTIGEGAVVGARAAVFKDVEPWTILGGNPAKFIKKREI